MQRMWTKVIRHRLVFLVGVLVTAALLAALSQADIRVVSAVCPGLLGLLWAGLSIASLIARDARHPESFLVRAGTFTTPPNATAVLTAGMGTLAPMAFAALAVDQAHRRFGPDHFEILVLVLMFVLVPLQWYGVLGPFGVFLRPDGLLARQPLGSILVPWEAGLAAEPTGFGVKLQITHADQVVRRGLRTGRTIQTGADRGFTAWAINLYAARPDLRPMIGTDDGLRQLKTPPDH
jgi:hypothetical protein